MAFANYSIILRLFLKLKNRKQLKESYNSASWEMIKRKRKRSLTCKHDGGLSRISQVDTKYKKHLVMNILTCKRAKETGTLSS